jgi:hypothetical protein
MSPFFHIFKFKLLIQFEKIGAFNLYNLPSVSDTAHLTYSLLKKYLVGMMLAGDAWVHQGY